jgi:hypothetical protein
MCQFKGKEYYPINSVVDAIIKEAKLNKLIPFFIQDII